MTMMIETTAKRVRERVIGATLLTAMLLLAAGCGAGSPADDTAEGSAGERTDAAASALPAPRILEPAQDAELSGPVRVVLDAENVDIVPAGEERPNSGHHHLFLNAAPVAEGEPIPAGVDGIVHLGNAQTGYTFDDLSPGEYTLVAMIGDFAHRAIPQATDTVRFRVVETES